MKSKAFVVIGMHRSATSLVAKALMNEIHMGNDLLPSERDNPKGFWENLRFIELNDRILTAAGGTWWQPPPEAKILDQEPNFREEIRSLIAQESNGRKLWGWKDPRTTLTVRLYLPHLEDPHFICCFRQPAEVAQSQRRVSSLFPHRPQKLDQDEWLTLAREYNQRLLVFLSECFA